MADDVEADFDEVLGELRFKKVDDLGGKLKELCERWDNRLVLKEASVWEHYISGRLTLVCDLQAIRNKAKSHSNALAEREGNSHHQRAIVTIQSDEVMDGVDVDDRHDHTVLVDVVEFPNSPNGTAAIIRTVSSFVRFYLVEDKVCNFGCGSLYRVVPTRLLSATALPPRWLGVREGPYKFIPRFVEWESLSWDDLVNQIIESTAEVVDSIPEGQGGIDGHVIDRTRHQHPFAGRRIILNHHATEIRLEEITEDLFELRGMLFGPLDL